MQESLAFMLPERFDKLIYLFSSLSPLPLKSKALCLNTGSSSIHFVSQTPGMDKLLDKLRRSLAQ
jgi:hypothetical protein